MSILGERKKILFLWIGDAKKRHLKAIKLCRPDYLYFVSESKDSKWHEYHDEVTDWLTNQIGAIYEDILQRINIKEKNVSEEDYNSHIIAEISKHLKLLRRKYGRLEVTWDVTGAPTGAQQVLSLIAALLANLDTKMYVQTIQRKEENDPIFHASKNSKYYKKHSKEQHNFADLPLSQWREKEANDEGGNARRLLCPALGFELLDDCPINKERKKRLADQLLFLTIPSSRCEKISTSEILSRMEQYDDKRSNHRTGKHIIHESTIHRNNKNNGKNKNKRLPYEKYKQSIKIWISTKVGEFGALGLTDSIKIGKELYVVKTEAGDMFTSAVKNLYEFFSENENCEIVAMENELK